MTKLLSKNEVCDVIGIKVSTLNNLMKKKLIRYHKLGRHVRFRDSDLVEYVERYAVELNQVKHCMKNQNNENMNCEE